MPPLKKAPAGPWLEHPLRTGVGEIQVAGLLRDIPGINPNSMRILGSYALILMVEGTGYYRDRRGLQETLQPGDVVLVYPELAHAYGPAENEEWTQVYFVFAGGQFDLWRSAGLLQSERPVWRLGAPQYWLGRLAEVFADEAGRAGGGRQPVRAMGKFLDVLTEMIASRDQAARASAPEAWLEKSLQLLGAQRKGAWPAPEAVAAEIGLGYETFRKRFAERTGESPGQYQKRRRLERACGAIYRGEQSLKQIADELGFCDVFHFSKAFKQLVGTTPTEYRARMRGR